MAKLYLGDSQGAPAIVKKEEVAKTKFGTSIDLSSLTSIGTNGLNYVFSNCTGLTKISFPALTSVTTNCFGGSASTSAFYRCTTLTEIHFRADMQETIEAMSNYSNKWGATDATIYFDL